MLKMQVTLKRNCLSLRQESARPLGIKRVLLFSQGAAESLYNNQMITSLDILQDLTDDIIKELCRAIRKPGGDVTGHQISELSVTRLKLFCLLGKAHVVDFKRS